jgi:cobalt-zinc-cadmium resistance protein CzcA
MTGAKSDISVKLFGEDPKMLKAKADEIAEIVKLIPGAGDVKVDQTDGLQQLSVRLDRDQMARYGIQVKDVNLAIRAAYAGEVVGSIYEEERKFDLVVRLASSYRDELDLTQLSISGRNGDLVQLSEVATVVERESPMLISREGARRFVNVGINVRDRDVASLVAEIQSQLEQQLTLPPGYEMKYGGQFENLQRASQRLLIAVPLALFLILLMLYLSFGTFRDALVIFVAVPLSAIGGILALQFRGMPFSISSGIGFIALFGISVLNGIVLISAIKQLKKESFSDFKVAIIEAAATRLRPVLMTAAVAAFGFLPMALSTGNGAEVQRPLATVVIGGLISSTLLTLVVLPALYYLVNKNRWKKALYILAPLLLLVPTPSNAQSGLLDFESIYSYALGHHPTLKNQELAIEAELLNRDKVGAWSPLEITYQGGQINTGDVDHSFSASQNLNHLFNRRLQGQVIESSKQVLEAERSVLANDLRFSLREAYEKWAYRGAQARLVDSLYQLHLTLESDLELRYRAGVIGVLDLELFKQELADYQQQRTTAWALAQLAETEMRTSAFLPDSMLLSLPPPRHSMLSLPVTTDPANPQIKVLDQQIIQLSSEQDLASRISRQPQLSAGYFLQSLEKDFAFQGVSVGIGIPLDRRITNAQTEQTKLYQQQLLNEQSRLSENYRLRINSLKSNLGILQTELTRYTNEISAGQDRILEIARLQLKEGEIDFLTFSQLSRRLLGSRIDHLERIHQYNLYTIELQFLTSNQQ